MDIEQEKYRRSRRRWIGASLFTIALLVASSCFQLYLSYREHLEAIDDNLEKLSLALLKQAESEFRSTELALRYARERLQARSNPDEWTDKAVYDLFLNIMGTFSKAESGVSSNFLFWVDSEGVVRVTSYEYPSPPIAADDRDYFVRHRESRSPDVYYSGNLQSRLTQNWVVFQTARLTDSRGRFAGVVGISSRIDAFGVFSDELNLGPGGSLIVAHAQGRWSYRYPFKPEYAGINFVDSETFKQMQAKPSGRYLFSDSTYDGLDRRAGFHWDNNKQLIAMVTLSEDAAWEAFAPLMRQRILLLLFTVAVLVAAMFAYNRIFKKTREAMKLATIDSLTHIPNRRYLDERLEQAWLSAQRDNKSLGIIFIDIDYFKRYNDDYGHEAGDACLQKVAETIQEVLKRPDDFVARYGGEEFIVLLPGNDFEQTEAIANKLLWSIRRVDISHRGSPIADHLTISLGFSAIVPERGQESRLLKSQADQALYAAKARGRNQAVGLPYTKKAEL